jgi:cobalt/nickel transport system permease protein
VSAGHVHASGPAGRRTSLIHRLDPRAKIVGLVAVTAVSVSTPLTAWPVWLGCVAVLITVAGLAGVGPRLIWRRARVVLPLVLFVAVFIPFAREGDRHWSLGPIGVSDTGLALLAEVSAKAVIGTVCAVVLAATTPVSDLIRGLEALRVPRLLTLIAAFMYRYLFVIRDELRRMRTALSARGYRPRNLLAVAPLGRMVTAMFLRSYGRGERVYLAMAARGYRGTMPQLAVLRIGAADVVFVLAVLAAVLPLRVIL